jgi:hypothetical protein
MRSPYDVGRLTLKMSRFAQLHTATRRIRYITDGEGELSPMPPPMIGDPKHWRDRAARMQAMAVKMAGSLAAILMNDLAIHYDNLADQALKVRHREREIK